MEAFGAGGPVDASTETPMWSILRISIMDGDGEMHIVTV